MTTRATLEQLKAMGDKELTDQWHRGSFPFDFAPCGHCMTGHLLGHVVCHSEIRSALMGMGYFKFSTTVTTFLREHIEELYALRLFHDEIYDPQPVETVDGRLYRGMGGTIESEKLETNTP